MPNWLDVIDTALTQLCNHAEEYYTPEVAEAHGRLQGAIMGEWLSGEPISQVQTATSTTIDVYADVDMPPEHPDVPLATVPGQVTGLADACLGYRVAECCYNACVARWGEASEEAQLAGETVHHWGMQVFFAGGDAGDIEREQVAAQQNARCEEAQQ
jgi:hypothetical protein